MLSEPSSHTDVSNCTRAWVVATDQLTQGQVQQLATRLDPSEHERLGRLRDPRDRASYAAAHALRRHILAQTSGIEPAALHFSHNAAGQAFVNTPTGRSSPSISLSHTRGAAAFALSSVEPVGIDVEKENSDFDDYSVLEPYIESDFIHRESKVSSLTRHWTLIEAYWKRIGRGLPAVPQRIHVAQRKPHMFTASHQCSAEPHTPVWLHSHNPFQRCWLTLASHFDSVIINTVQPAELLEALCH